MTTGIDTGPFNIYSNRRAYSSGSLINSESTISFTTAIGGVYGNGVLTFLEIRVYN